MERVLAVLLMGALLTGLGSCENIIANRKDSANESELKSQNYRSEGRTSILVTNVRELFASTELAVEGDLSVHIADGIYELPQSLTIIGDNVTLRSASGKRAGVIIRAKGTLETLIKVRGCGFALMDLTLGESLGSLLHIERESEDLNLYVGNVRFYNGGESMLKAGRAATGRSDYRNGQGVIENCLFEYLPEGGGAVPFCGIELNNIRGWTVQGNIFHFLKGGDSLGPYKAALVIHNADESLIAENRIGSAGVGILQSGDSDRQGLIVKNNMIRTRRGAGISLQGGVESEILHNTVIVETRYEPSIEYRNGGTSAAIRNNLSNRPVRSRDGAYAELSNNFIGAESEWFVDPASVDLHLKAVPSLLKNSAESLVMAESDFDGDLRQSVPLPGADEF